MIIFWTDEDTAFAWLNENHTIKLFDSQEKAEKAAESIEDVSCQPRVISIGRID
jgi:hypothetical protein